MGYLFLKLFWFVVLAFVIGLAVGWVTCNGADNERA